MKSILFPVFLCFSLALSAQDYTNYFTGDESDVTPETLGGLVLMGGATENDQAMQWFLEKANGGDVVVIRTSGSDGYNNYLYSDLEIGVNSVESIVMHNADAANDPYIIQQIENAEALWIAGGNQWTYVNEWRGEGVGDAVNYLLNEKGAVVGGTSAGMAVLGGTYFTAENGTIQSSTALSDPFHPNVTLGHGDFLNADYMENVVTDQHYNNPDRRGRHVTFMARMENDLGQRSFGIASDEYTAVCVETDGTARAFGDYPDYNDYVYFLQSNCFEDGPEEIEPNTPLTWNRDNKAIQVYKVPASNSGENYFDLNSWENGNGGEWQNWWVEAGELMVDEDADAPNCITGVPESAALQTKISPTISDGMISITVDADQWRWQLVNISGQQMSSGGEQGNTQRIDFTQLPAGMYLMRIEADEKEHTQKLILR